MSTARKFVRMTMDESKQGDFRDRSGRRAKAKRNGKDMPPKATVPAAEGSLDRYTTPFRWAERVPEKSLFCTKGCG